MPLLAKFFFFVWSFKLLQQVYNSFSLQKINNGRNGKIENYLNYKYFQCPLFNLKTQWEKKLESYLRISHEASIATIATTFFSKWRRQVTIADGSHVPIVTKELSKNNVLVSYAYIHTFLTYHPINAFHFFPFLVHLTILIKNLWLRRPQENNWKMLDAKLLNVSVIENLFPKAHTREQTL